MKQVSKKTPLKKPDYLEFRLPKFSFKNTSLNAWLVYTLVIFAFLLGMLVNKIIYLEQAIKISPTPTPSQVQGAAVPTPPAVVKNLGVGKLPLLGDKQAKVTVVEFSDFQCPFCKRYFDETQKQLTDAYINTGKIKFAYRHYPLSSIHPNAEKAAEASECANEQGKFWDFHDLLFTNQDTWAPKDASGALDSFTDYAGQLGLDTTQFRACVETGKYKDTVALDQDAGTTAQVDGTPSFFVNGTRITGAVPFADLQKAIEEELKK